MTEERIKKLEESITKLTQMLEHCGKRLMRMEHEINVLRMSSKGGFTVATDHLEKLKMEVKQLRYELDAVMYGTPRNFIVEEVKNSLEGKIRGLDNELEAHHYQLDDIRKEIRELVERMNILEQPDLFRKIEVTRDYHLKPSACPVCGGRGTVSSDFYTKIQSTASLEEVKCESCNGAGVLWG